MTAIESGGGARLAPVGGRPRSGDLPEARGNLKASGAVYESRHLFRVAVRGLQETRDGAVVQVLTARMRVVVRRPLALRRLPSLLEVELEFLEDGHHLVELGAEFLVLGELLLVAPEVAAALLGELAVQTDDCLELRAPPVVVALIDVPKDYLAQLLLALAEALVLLLEGLHALGLDVEGLLEAAAQLRFVLEIPREVWFSFWSSKRACSYWIFCSSRT